LKEILKWSVNMDDHLSEEELIAQEQDSEGTALCSRSFLKPIKELALPKVIAVEECTSINDTINLMQEKKIGSVVVTHQGELTGIFTERDVLMKVINKISDIKGTKINEVMTHRPQCLQAGDEIAYALNNMHVGGYRHVPIVDENGRPSSMVSIKDVLSWILDFFPQDITNLAGEPFRGKKEREGA
jgi:CBS domain-containing protein